MSVCGCVLCVCVCADEMTHLDTLGPTTGDREVRLCALPMPRIAYIAAAPSFLAYTAVISANHDPLVAFFLAMNLGLARANECARPLPP